MKHTRGPWEVNPYSVTEVLTGNVICDRKHDANSSELAQWDANGKLIAAAPSLLIALNNCLRYIADITPEVRNPIPCVEAAREVIRSAMTD
jgi:hypothetical protein